MLRMTADPSELAVKARVIPQSCVPYSGDLRTGPGTVSQILRNRRVQGQCKMLKDQFWVETRVTLNKNNYLTHSASVTRS